MTRTYKINASINNYMFFTLDDRDAFKKMHDFDIDAFGNPLPFTWVPPCAQFIKSDSGSEIVPDITQWNGNDLIISSSVKSVLEIQLSDLGEFYPLAGRCQNYWLFNPIHRVGNKVINLEKTRSSYFDDGAWEKIEKLVFDRASVNQLPIIFTLQIDRGVNLYCTQDLKRLIENHNFDGLIFIEQEML
jgi:hypothetical protein